MLILSSVAGGAEHAPGVVAAPVVPALGPEEDILTASAMLAGTGQRWPDWAAAWRLSKSPRNSGMSTGRHGSQRGLDKSRPWAGAGGTGR